MIGYPNSPKLIKGGIVLLDLETPRVAMPKSESICEEGGGSGGMGNNPEPSRDALDFWVRWEKLSFKKQMALRKMLGVKTAKDGETGSGTVLMQWRKPMGETVIRRVKNVTLEFQRVGPEIEGDKLWIFRSTSDKAYRLVDRPGKFHFPLKQDIRLIVINAGEGKK